jgi:hypothetical protein
MLSCMYQFKERMVRTELCFPHPRKAMLAYKPRRLAGNVIPIPLYPSGLIVFGLFSEKQTPSSSGRYATRVVAHFNWEKQTSIF